MLYHFLYPFAKQFRVLNVLTYISLRAVGAAVTALLLSFIFGPIILRALRKQAVNQVVREGTPLSHAGKGTTPTIGGLIILNSALVSVLLFAALILAWHLAVRGTAPTQQMDPEYAKLMGVTATQGKSAMPGPLDVGAKLWEHIRRPFYDNGPNDKGVGIQLAYSIARAAGGYLLAVLVAIPTGFLIGMSPLFSKALDPFIQVLKPISPLAWMPLALYTIKDSRLSAIFVIFICSLWPMLINTAFGVAAVRKEWLNVARTLEVGTLRRAFTIILPAAAPGQCRPGSPGS